MLFLFSLKSRAICSRLQLSYKFIIYSNLGDLVASPPRWLRT